MRAVVYIDYINVFFSAALKEGASSARARPMPLAPDRLRCAVGLHGVVEVALDLGLLGKSLGQLRFDRGAFALRKMAARSSARSSWMWS